MVQGVTTADAGAWIFTSLLAPPLGAFPVLPSWCDNGDD